MDGLSLGFRIAGSCREKRRPIDWPAAFAAYCNCDPRAQVNREAHLSAFVFDEDFCQLLEETGSVRGYAGSCWAPWLWVDIDREGDMESARRDASQLVLNIQERYQLANETMLIFFSGSKGFHVGLSTGLFKPAPSSTYHQITRRYAEACAQRCSLGIDVGVYDKVHPLRAPNSRHPKTGLYKRRLTLDELANASVEAIRKLAAEPQPFDPPKPVEINADAIADWANAVEAVKREAKAAAERRTALNGKASLNRLTLDFIRNGAEPGDRHRLLYSAARNLGEYGCSLELAIALLSEAARDSGLPPGEVQRQIECGVHDATN
jgi:hypothetical protein